ncbi:MAG: hypothetical protein WAW45_07130, partial [Atribacterota bacterium]
MLNKTEKKTKEQNIQNLRKKTVLNHFLCFLSFVLTSIFILSLSFILLMNSVVNAQTDFLFDKQIEANAITRFWEGFTEYEIRLFWSPFQLEMADEYRIFKSVNKGDFEQIKADYKDEGFQLSWTDEDVLDRNSYSYYIEGYLFGELVGRTEQVDVDFWLPSCPALFPVNNEIVSEEEPEFRWQSISISTFPFKNVIFSAEGEFVAYDLTEEEEIWR